MKSSRTERLLKHLQKGGKITGKTAMSKFGLYRLSEYVRRYRLKGYNVVTSMVTRGGITYASYAIDSDKKQKAI